MPNLSANEIIQRVRDNRLKLELETLPDFVSEFYTSNILQRTLAQLVGVGERTSIPVKASEGGRLLTLSLPGGFTHNDRTTGSIGDSYTEFVFADICERVDIWVESYGAILKRAATALGSYDDEFYVLANQFYSFDCSCAKISYKAKTATENGTIQIIGWY